MNASVEHLRIMIASAMLQNNGRSDNEFFDSLYKLADNLNTKLNSVRQVNQEDTVSRIETAVQKLCDLLRMKHGTIMPDANVVNWLLDI